MIFSPGRALAHISGSGALYGELLLIVAAAGAWWLACAYEDELIAVS
jgi:hypothetical protein